MKSILIALTLFISACNNEGTGNQNMEDSAVIQPVDGTIQNSDTDDFNKPSPETTPLDAPPDYSRDSSKNN